MKYDLIQVTNLFVMVVADMILEIYKCCAPPQFLTYSYSLKVVFSLKVGALFATVEAHIQNRNIFAGCTTLSSSFFSRHRMHIPSVLLLTNNGHRVQNLPLLIRLFLLQANEILLIPYTIYALGCLTARVRWRVPPDYDFRSPNPFHDMRISGRFLVQSNRS
jgi:hypothetical protein